MSNCPNCGTRLQGRWCGKCRRDVRADSEFGEITEPHERLARERKVLISYIDGLIAATTGKPAEPGTEMVVDAFEQAVRAAARAPGRAE